MIISIWPRYARPRRPRPGHPRGARGEPRFRSPRCGVRGPLPCPGAHFSAGRSSRA